MALVKKVDNIFLNSEINFWLQKVRNQEIDLPELYEPYKLLREGKINKAADFWQKKGCPFQKAFALFEGTEEDKKNALILFQQLGANAVAEKIKMEMRAVGIKKNSERSKRKYKDKPCPTNQSANWMYSGLLQKGNPNKEIAGTLFISPKTAENHISNILFKLDVKTRSKAITEAVRLGILK